MLMSLALTGSACAGNGEPRVASSPTDAAPARSATPTETPSPTPTAIPGWTACVNEQLRYSIGYPRDWFTTSTDPHNECRWFDPERFELERQTEAPFTALRVQPSRQPFDAMVRRVKQSDTHRLIDAERVSVAGHDGLRYERVQTEPLLLPEGTHEYGYVIDRDGRAFLVATTKPPQSDVRYERNQEVVDQAARTVRFGEDA